MPVRLQQTHLRQLHDALLCAVQTRDYSAGHALRRAAYVIAASGFGGYACGGWVEGYTS